MIDSNILKIDKILALNVSRETLRDLEDYSKEIIIRNSRINLISKNTEKSIKSLKKADGLVVGSAICKEISVSIQKRQNPVTNVANLVKKLKYKIL